MMNRMKTMPPAALVLGTFIGVVANGFVANGVVANDVVSAQPVDQQALKQEAVSHIKAFGGELQAAVKAGVMQGGPQNAILVCNQQAPAIAEKHSGADWSIGRTSLKLRNPNNAPTAWETEVLQDFEAKLAGGADPKTLTASKVEDGQFHFMKAITVGNLCLNCHGETLDAPVASRLSELYPGDKATGYKLGELRGAFTLSRPLD